MVVLVEMGFWGKWVFGVKWVFGMKWVFWGEMVDWKEMGLWGEMCAYISVYRSPNMKKAEFKNWLSSLDIPINRVKQVC